ncbi:MAG: lipid-A-disaccharide synthase, partial [Candidatus Omnitrophica bacterium]|nr:lipid-A-disaccharide synthase [Candidatus Omnitrophota bacterium]
MSQRQILIICGEASGDLNAGNLTKNILKIDPDIKILGVGGPHLRSVGANIFYDIKDLAAIGLFDVLGKLPRFIKLQSLILSKIKRYKPDAIIFVDFSGFNLRLAKKINNRIPTIYYISPQVWASREGRIKTIKKYISKMIVIFKFEEEFYRRHGVSVDFVGHPLLDTVKPSTNREEFLRKFNLSTAQKTIALLPGSRATEVKNILPIMLGACVDIAGKFANTQFIIVKSPQVNQDIYNSKIKGVNLNLQIIEGKVYDCLNASDFCLVASGTATLETAIMEKPFLIIYKMPLLNYLLYRPQVKVPFIGIVNIVAKRKIVPEFIQFQATPKKIAEETIKFLEHPFKMKELEQAISRIK